MTNTYAINVTRGKEFAVENDLQNLGLHPWVPRQLASKYVKERRETVWYDRPYVGKLIFCVIPAIYWPDVIAVKHVIGKPFPFSRMDIEGQPAYTDPAGRHIPEKPGLKTFRTAVEAEYADTQRRQRNSEYKCQYEPGQALEILSAGFEGIPAVFVKAIKSAHDDYHKLRVATDMFGQSVSVDLDPDKVTLAQ